MMLVLKEAEIIVTSSHCALHCCCCVTKEWNCMWPQMSVSKLPILC